MPSIIGLHHLSLTVTDLDRSVAWYAEVLGFAVHSRVQGEAFRRVRLRPPGSNLVLTLTQHDAGAGDVFDETRTGLDHVAFQVATLADLDGYARTFTERDVVHSGVNHLPGGPRSITARDPDNIQLEVFALGTAAGTDDPPA